MEEQSGAKELLRLAAELERKVADIYRRFHELFVDDKMAGYLWHSLSVEEDGHADFLESEMKMLDKVPSAFGDVRVSIGEVEKALGRVEEIDKRVGEKKVDLKEAVCIALTLEKDIVEGQYARLVEISSPSLKRIFAEITGESDHMEKLLTVAKKLGVECR